MKGRRCQGISINLKRHVIVTVGVAPLSAQNGAALPPARRNQASVADAFDGVSLVVSGSSCKEEAISPSIFSTRIFIRRSNSVRSSEFVDACRRWTWSSNNPANHSKYAGDLNISSDDSIKGKTKQGIRGSLYYARVISRARRGTVLSLAC